MYREKPIPPFFLLITIFLACVAVVPSGGAAVMQEDPGFDITLTPPGGYEVPEFCTMIPGDTAVPCDPAFQKVIAGTRISGSFTMGSPGTSSEVPREYANDCPLMAACPDGYTGFCIGSNSDRGSVASGGFAEAGNVAYSGSVSGSLASAGSPPDKPVRATGAQGLQFAGVSATALDFSEVSSGEAATGGFAYPGYRGSGSRASVSSPRAHYTCRF